MEDKLESFRNYIYRMQGYGSMSGSCADEVLRFVAEQQKEIEKLKSDKQVLSHYKYMYEQAKY